MLTLVHFSYCILSGIVRVAKGQDTYYNCEVVYSKIPGCKWWPDWKSDISAHFEAFDRREVQSTFSFAGFATVRYSCGRRRRISMWNSQNVSYPAFQLNKVKPYCPKAIVWTTTPAIRSSVLVAIHVFTNAAFRASRPFPRHDVNGIARCFDQRVCLLRLLRGRGFPTAYPRTSSAELGGA